MRGLVLTQVEPITTTKGTTMSDHSTAQDKDSLVDAWAIFMLILIAVSTAVFWVSQQ